MGPRTRSVAALVVLMIAGLASLATSRGPSSTTDELALVMSLEFDDAVTSQWLHVDVPQGVGAVHWLDLSVSSDESDFALSLFGAEETARRPLDVDYGRWQSVSLAQACAPGCSKDILMVARRDGAGGPMSGFVNASIDASFENRDVEVQLSRASPAPIEIANPPASASSSVTGTITVAANDGTAIWNGLVAAPAEAMPDSDWVSGAILPRGDLELTGAMEALIEFTVRVGANETSYALFGDETFAGFGTDWVTQCPRNQSCLVPVEVVLRWPTVAGEQPPESGVATVEFTLEATLEHLDRLELPPGAVVNIGVAP